MVLNTTLLLQQPSAPKATGFVECFLMEYTATGEGEAVWRFLYNPESVSTQKNARYSTTPVMGELPSTAFNGPSARVVSLDNLILDGWSQGRSMNSLAEGLERLTKAVVDGDAGTLGAPGEGFTYTAPPVLSFIMGGRTVISPCVLTETSRVETGWMAGGEIAIATLSMTLKEVSQADLRI